MTKLTRRRFQTEEDFWRMRAFLREVFPLNHCLERSWSVPRLDYWRWHFTKTCESNPMDQVTFLWETQEGKLAATLHAIDLGEAFIGIHPAHRDFELENEIFSVAEQHLSRENQNGEKRLVTLVDEDDPLRRDVCKARGFFQRDYYVKRWRRDLDTPIPAGKPIPGYRIRSMGDADEYKARALASWRAFHPEEPDEGAGDGEWFINMESAPLYRRDLDIVAEAPNGEIAAFSTIWYDDVNRSAVCVVVGPAQEHQRQGLGKAVILEGLRRLQKMGAKRVFANGFDTPGNALYGSSLGTCIKAESWIKIIS